jgi:hypothetical protein
VIENMGQLLDALDDIPYPPFEMAVLDSSGRAALVFADEDAVLGILRLPYEDEPCRVQALNAESFPMQRLVLESTERQHTMGTKCWCNGLTDRECVEPGCTAFPDATWERCTPHQATREAIGPES